jgi:hypothetical protein
MLSARRSVMPDCETLKVVRDGKCPSAQFREMPQALKFRSKQNSSEAVRRPATQGNSHALPRYKRKKDATATPKLNSIGTARRARKSRT